MDFYDDDDVEDDSLEDPSPVGVLSESPPEDTGLQDWASGDVSFEEWTARNPDTIAQLDALVEQIARIPFDRVGQRLSLVDDIAKILSFVHEKETGKHVLTTLEAKLKSKKKALKSILKAWERRVPGYLLPMALGLSSTIEEAERASEFRESSEGQKFTETLQFRAADAFLSNMEEDIRTATDCIAIFRNIVSKLLVLVENEMLPENGKERIERMSFKDRVSVFIETIRAQERSAKISMFAQLVSGLRKNAPYDTESIAIVRVYMDATAGYNRAVDPYKKVFGWRIGDKIPGQRRCQVCKSAPVQGKCTDCQQQMCKDCYAAH